ncbi:hypothetical protein L1987_04805 [Smallanthus sonchifolius]|uniref:Uncharacterized protein n=1 Tax=Smallanthus sonchifolius TaxID=185202 RepID=A0ACB9JTR9_9ASTR|nr:hypothetical protein L1987_04805 [Smallanthus sonchifolius]
MHVCKTSSKSLDWGYTKNNIYNLSSCMIIIFHIHIHISSERSNLFVMQDKDYKKVSDICPEADVDIMQYCKFHGPGH